MNREAKTGLWKGFLWIILEKGNVLSVFCGLLASQDAHGQIMWEMFHTLMPLILPSLLSGERLIMLTSPGC